MAIEQALPFPRPAIVIQKPERRQTADQISEQLLTVESDYVLAKIRVKEMRETYQEVVRLLAQGELPKNVKKRLYSGLAFTCSELTIAVADLEKVTQQKKGLQAKHMEIRKEFAPFRNNKGFLLNLQDSV
jgi:hypothetical protein